MGFYVTSRKTLEKSRSSETGRDLRVNEIWQARSEKSLVVILLTGAGISLSLMVPACLEDPGVTIAVVPLPPLFDNLAERAKKAGIDNVEWRPNECIPSSSVYVSANFGLKDGGFQSYRRPPRSKGLLKGVLCD